MTRVLILTLCLAVAMAVSLADHGQAPTQRGDDEALLPEDRPAPVIPPVLVEARPASRRRALVAEGTVIFDRVAPLRKSEDGRWWTIPDPRVGELRLLPCRLLEAVENIHARHPKRRFRFSGEVCRYRRRYYLLLRQAEELVPAATTRPARRKVSPAAAVRTRPARPTSWPVPRSSPARPGSAAPEDIARELLKDVPRRPVLPVAESPGRAEPVKPVAPTRRPIPAGPGGMVANRLARLVYDKGSGWFLVTFISDNTLREPPMRVLPNLMRQRMEDRSAGGNAPGAVFYVSGEVHRYRHVDYLLLRNVLLKRDLDLF